MDKWRGSGFCCVKVVFVLKLVRIVSLRMFFKSWLLWFMMSGIVVYVVELRVGGVKV